MWLYSQSTGNLWDDRGIIIAVGYSGKGEGKNNPGLEAVPFVGPIPRGDWLLGEPYDSEKVGPFAIPLSPHKHNALNRTDFLIHGDSKANFGNASEGCIIFPRPIRERIIKEADKFLRVIE